MLISSVYEIAQLWSKWQPIVYSMSQLDEIIKLLYFLLEVIFLNMQIREYRLEI